MTFAELLAGGAVDNPGDGITNAESAASVAMERSIFIEYLLLTQDSVLTLLTGTQHG